MIGFVGLSHLGVVSSIATASKGFRVTAYDPNAELCAALGRGELPVFEPGLPELLAATRSQITFTSDANALAKCRVIYFSQDVTTDENNVSDLRPLEALIAHIAPLTARNCTLVVLSQVSPGFTRRLAKELDRDVFYQVETLIFGRAVERALYPERFIIGCDEPKWPLPVTFAELLRAFDCPIFPMRYESAELCKVSINLCLVASVSVANTLAEICEAIGADWSEIVPTLKLDKRIGPHSYLAPGLGISGGNLERDLVTVRGLAHEWGTDAGIVDAWLANSRHRRDWVLRMLHREDPSSVAVWGLAYKAGTKSTKNSPALALLGDLCGAHSPLSPVLRGEGPGVRGRTDPHPRPLSREYTGEGRPDIAVFDPQVALPQRYRHVTQADNPLQACENADALVIMTPWPEFASVPLADIAAAMRGRIIIDPFAVFDTEECAKHGLVHIRLGTSNHMEAA